MSHVSITVGGVDVTTKMVEGSLQFEDMLNGRSTLRVSFHDVVGGFIPQDGAPVVVEQDGERIFAGMLIEPEENEPEASANHLWFHCQCVDNSGKADRHLVARAYTDTLAGDIVRDILAQDMADEEIDPSGIEDGPLIKKAVFNWVNATQAFNQISELTGMPWHIDEDNVFVFHERTSVPAPLDIDYDTALNGTIRVRPDRQQYRNHQVLRAGAGLTDSRTETFVGDGERRTFNTAFKVGTQPTITVNAVSQTVGIRQVETGKQWYWNKGASEISQDGGSAELTASDVLSVTYQGLFPIILAATRGAEIQARKAIEGGSGRYSKVEERSNIETIDAATAAVQAILDRYGTIGKILNFQTRLVGFKPGQIATVNLARHGIVGEEYLIETVSGAVVADLNEVWFAIRAISGDPFGGWQEYFRRIQRIGREFVINDNEVVVGLIELSDAAIASESISVTSAAPERRVDVARVDFSAVRAS